MTDDEKTLFDAQTDAQALMRDSANVAVLREAVEDWKREAARLKARVLVLEACLTRIADYKPVEVCKDDFAYDRMVAGFHAAARSVLPPKERP